MSKIPIQKKDNLNEEIAAELKAEFRKAVVSSEQKSKSGRKLLFFSLAVLLLGLTALSYAFFFAPKPVFSDLAPDQAVLFATIDQVALYNQAVPFYDFLQEPYPYVYSALAKINGYLEASGLNFASDIQSLVKEDVGLAVMPANSEAALPWVLIFEKKFAWSQAEFEQNIEKIGKALKSDYGMTTVDYRQVKIISLDFLRLKKPGVPDMFFAAEVRDYIVVGNSQEVIRDVIDKVIK